MSLQQTHTHRSSALLVGLAVAVAVALSVAVLATPAAASADVSVDAADLEDELFWAGQQVEITGLEAEETVQLREESTDDRSSLVRELITDGDGTVILDTSGKDAGDYYLAGGGASGDDAVFELAVQDLSAGFEGADGDSDNGNDSDPAYATLTILVEDTEGDPIPSANVSITDNDSAGDGAILEGAIVSEDADNGTFTAELPDGNYTVNASAAAFEPATEPVELAGENETVTLQLEEALEMEPETEAETPPPTDEPMDTDADADDGAGEDDHAAETAADDQPGFGVLGAVAAAIGVALIAARHSGQRLGGY